MQINFDALRQLVVDPENFAHARRAKERFDVLIAREFAPLVRTVTRNPNLKVVSWGSAPATDGKTVYLQTPWALGETLEHNTALCALRDEGHLSLCPACRISDEVRADMWHESAHITERSFEEMSRHTLWLIIKERFQHELDTLDQHKMTALRDKFLNAPSSLAALKCVDKWLLMTWNVIEDIYVNRRLYAARPGVEPGMQATTVTAFTKGLVDPNTGKPADRGRDLDAMMVPYLIGHGLDGYPGVKDYFGPEHVGLFDDADLKAIVDDIPSECSIGDRFDLSLRLLVKLRELGFLPRPQDSLLPPQPPAPTPPPSEKQEPQPDQGEEQERCGETQSSESEADENDEGEDESESDEEGEAGDGESDESDEEESEPGEGSSSEADESEADDEEGEAGDGESDESEADEADDEEGEAGDGESDESEADDESEEEGEGGGGDTDDEQDSEDESEEGEGEDEGDGEAGDGESEAESEPEAGPTDDEIDAMIEKAIEAMTDLMGHGQEDQATPEQEAAMTKADAQVDFDDPSYILNGLQIVEPYRFSGGAKPIVKPNEAIMARPLSHLRVVFAENKRTGMRRDLRRGPTLDKRHLHRAGADDYRIFGKRDIPKTRDWSVVVGVDFSSSNNSNGALRPVKEVSATIAELLHRLGIPFQFEGHTGTNRYLTHTIVKDFDTPWNKDSLARLNEISGMGGNMDGHSMERYRKLAEARRTTDKLILYFTDGEMHGYGEEREILEKNIDLCRKLGIHLLAVSYQNDSPTQLGLETIRFDSGQDIASIVSGLDAYLSTH